jgi:hypothetical protein
VSIKSDILDKIKKKVKKRELLSEEIAQRKNNVEAFILKMVDELDADVSSMALMQDVVGLHNYYIGSIEQRIKVLDTDVGIEVLWDTTDNTRVSGILVKWSKTYQQQNNCEEQLLVDINAFLLK